MKLFHTCGTSDTSPATALRHKVATATTRETIAHSSVHAARKKCEMTLIELPKKASFSATVFRIVSPTASNTGTDSFILRGNAFLATPTSADACKSRGSQGYNLECVCLEKREISQRHDTTQHRVTRRKGLHRLCLSCLQLCKYATLIRFFDQDKFTSMQSPYSLLYDEINAYFIYNLTKFTKALCLYIKRNGGGNKSYNG